MPEENAQNQPKKEKWLFRGNCLDSNNKMACEFEPLDEKGNLTGKSLIYSLKKNKHIVGGIYELDVIRDGERTTIYPSTLTYTTQFKNPELQQELRAAQLVFEQKERARKFEAKNKVNDLPDTWEEIVELYKKVPFLDRDWFEDLVKVKLRRDARK